MIRIFSEAEKRNSRNTDYRFWDNQPKECYSSEFTIQELIYIHNNPVEAGIVDKPEEQLYSSARDYYNKENCGLLKIVLFIDRWGSELLQVTLVFSYTKCNQKEKADAVMNRFFKYASENKVEDPWDMSYIHY